MPQILTAFLVSLVIYYLIRKIIKTKSRWTKLNVFFLIFFVSPFLIVTYLIAIHGCKIGGGSPADCQVFGFEAGNFAFDKSLYAGFGNGALVIPLILLANACLFFFNLLIENRRGK